MAWLMKPIYGVLGGALVVIAILTFTFYQGRASLRPALTQARAEAKALKTNRDEWISAYNGLKTAREADQREAANRLTQQQTACRDQVAAAQRSEDALRKMLAKPIRTDAKGCTIPGVLWSEQEPQRTALRPEAR